MDAYSDFSAEQMYEMLEALHDKYNNTDFIEAYLKKLRGYKTGGTAPFTGPAWLDGTPSRPEYVLNAAQTERFFSEAAKRSDHIGGESHRPSFWSESEILEVLQH